MSLCPCGSGHPLDACCGPYLDGAAAPTPEALMRSRYSAYVVGNIDHVERTHDSADGFDRAEAESMSRDMDWQSLEILSTTEGGADDDEGTVEFAARYKHKGEQQLHHEISNFHRRDGRWLYVNGVINPKAAPRTVEKVGRNDPCPCGSGKKFKKCCGG